MGMIKHFYTEGGQKSVFKEGGQTIYVGGGCCYVEEEEGQIVIATKTSHQNRDDPIVEMTDFPQS